MTHWRFDADERRARLARRHHLLASEPIADAGAALVTVAAAITQRAADLEAWLAGVTVTPRFPTPLDRQLRG